MMVLKQYRCGLEIIIHNGKCWRSIYEDCAITLTDLRIICDELHLLEVAVGGTASV